MKEIDDITIVGGGDIGLLTGLSIQKRNPEVNISVVDDFEEGQPDVGKSTFNGIIDILHIFLEIDALRFVQEVKPVFKSTVYFRDWCGYSPFHYPFDLMRGLPDENDQNLSEKYYYIYDEVYTNPRYRTSNEEIVEQRKTPYTFTPSGTLDRYEAYAYQLDTQRFNMFLRELCEERGISLVNDRISTVHADGDYITKIESARNTYESDIYIDASGFNRILKQELDDSFNDFEIPLDSAFNTQVDRPLADVVPSTVIETGEYGWFWQIDTFDNRDLGYVFASDYVSDEDALSEFLDYWDIPEMENEVRKYEFTSGYFENAWQGNCIAIGNAEGFVEPLQSTGLTANAQLGSALSTLLDAHNRTLHSGIRDTFNGYVKNIWESIHDFIFIHYKYSSGNNTFWDTMQSMEGSPRAKQIIEEYNKNGIVTTLTPINTTVNPINYDENIWNLAFFPLSNYYSIMRKMGAESEFYENNNIQVSDTVKEEINKTYESMQNEVDPYLTLEDFYQVIS